MEWPKIHIPLHPIKSRNNSSNEAEIWDHWRQKYVAGTPEEWVRQQVLHWLVREFHYPSGRIMVEAMVKGLKRNRRLDALVLDAKGCPYMLIEIKAPSVPLSNQTFLQAAHYNSQIKAPYLLVSNGMQTFVAKTFEDHFEFCQEIPEAPRT